jgi:hypothetical protein
MNTRADDSVKTRREETVMSWKVGVLLFLLAGAISPRSASAADATLYELIENMSIIRHGIEEHRLGWAALAGTARPGTLLCPSDPLDPARPCTIHATGTSSVKIATGEGTFSGDFAVVVPGDNDVDGPEFVILKGDFRGVMDFSPAFVGGQPYGLVHGTVGFASRAEHTPFTGIFHLPFMARDADNEEKPHYLQFTGLRPNGAVVRVRSNEKALGRPTVKFEICLGLTCGDPVSGPPTPPGPPPGSGLIPPPTAPPGSGQTPPPGDPLAIRG